MNIKKVKNTYNEYNAEGLSYGQLEAVRDALAQNHATVVGDEFYAEWSWYCDKLPMPGEDEEEIKAEQKAAKDGGKEGEIEGEDIPVALPPGSEAGTPPESGDEPLGYPPEEEGNRKEPRGLKVLKGEEKAAPAHGLPEIGMDGEGAPAQGREPDIDHELPPPPRE